MTRLWTLLSALMLVLSVAEPPDSPEENEVLKNPEELTKSQASDRGNPAFAFVGYSMSFWVMIASIFFFIFLFLTQVTENYIRNLSDTTLSHTPTTCKCYDLSCFSLLTCSSSKITFFVFAFAASLTTVSPSFGLAPRCPGNQVMLENSTDCGCPFGLVMSGDKCSCPVGFTLEDTAGCKGGWRQDQCFKEFSKNTQFETVAVAEYHLSLIHSYFIVKLSISIITPQMAHWQENFFHTQVSLLCIMLSLHDRCWWVWRRGTGTMWSSC